MIKSRTISLLLLLIIGQSLAINRPDCEIDGARDNADDNPTEEDDDVTISCRFDSDVDSCIWTHMIPSADKKSYDGDADFDVKCSSDHKSNGDSCDTDSRVRMGHQDSVCSITISSTTGDDTGEWKINAAKLERNNQYSTVGTEIELFTFNQSVNYMMDVDMSEDLDTIETEYNYDDKEEEWMDGKSSWETVEFQVYAEYARPEPQFQWFIENNDNDDLTDISDIFNIDSGPHSQYDGKYINNYYSKIEFQVDDRLLEFLESSGVDTNPESELVEFDINCIVNQDGYFESNPLTMRMRVAKKHDDGQLKGDTIGIIVGVVVAVALLVLVVALLIFAKSTSRWCFNDEEYEYQDPTNPKSRPRTHQGQPPPRSHHQPPQVHRDDDNEIMKSSAPVLSEPPSLKREIKKDDSGHSTSSQSSLRSSSEGTNDHTPPPRPPKSDTLNYANLELRSNPHNSSLYDPKNRVLPSGSNGALPPKYPPTAYATIVSNSTTSTTRVVSSNSKLV